MFNNNKKRKIMNKSAVFWLSFSPYVSAWPFISELKKYVGKFPTYFLTLLMKGQARNVWTKMGKIFNWFQTKTAQNPYPLGWHLPIWPI